MTIAVVRAPFRRSSNVKNLRSSNVKNIGVVSKLPHFCSIEESRGFQQSSHGGVQWGWIGAVRRRCVKWSRVLRHPSHYQTWICTTSRTKRGFCQFPVLKHALNVQPKKKKKNILVVFKYDHYTAYHSETLVLSVTNADGINRVKIKKKPKYIYMHAGEGAVMVQQPNLEYGNGKDMNKIQHDTLPILKHLCIIVINMLRFWNDFV